MRRYLIVMVSASVLLVSACSSIAETAVEQLAEGQEGVENVAIDDDGKITVEFEDEEGGGSFVIGGGDVPDGLPMPVPDGGNVMSSIEQGNTYSVMVMYPADRYDEILTLYADWVSGQDTTTLNETKSENPKSDGWSGEIGDASFVIGLFEGPGESGEPAVSVILSWEQ